MPNMKEIPEYNTLFSQCFSPDGESLAIGDHWGRVIVYKVSKLISEKPKQKSMPSREMMNALGIDVDPSQIGPKGVDPATMGALQICFQATDTREGRYEPDPVLSLASSKDDLIIGSVGVFSGWRWSDLQRRTAKRVWAVELPMLPMNGGLNEINTMEYDATERTAGRLFVGSGDSSVKVYDLETGKIATELQGHEDYIHGLSFCTESGSLASASEDGSARLWDLRSNRPEIASLLPEKEDKLNRPKLGKWIGAVDLSNSWVALGGGPRASLWHLRTLRPSNPLCPVEDNGIHVIKMAMDRIFIGGNMKKLYQTNFIGETMAEIAVSSSCIYSLAIRESPVSFLSCVGSSAYMDICTPNIIYKSKTLLFKPDID